MPKFRVHKLIRDNIIGMMQAEGQEVEYKQLAGRDLQKALLNKLKEEVDEAVDALDDDKELLIELADIREVFETFVAERGLAMSDIKRVQATKRQTKGGFTSGQFVEKITLKSSDEWARYYGNRPLQYQEILEDIEASDEQFNVPFIAVDLYQHYKGRYFEVIGVGCDTKMRNYFVIYRSLYKAGSAPEIWIQPYRRFIESVEVDGELRPRFRRLGQ